MELISPTTTERHIPRQPQVYWVDVPTKSNCTAALGLESSPCHMVNPELSQRSEEKETIAL
jgi:hypothetical protein